MRTVVVIGTENREALETAVWFEKKEDQIYSFRTVELVDKNKVEEMFGVIAKEVGSIDILIIQYEKHLQDDGKIGSGRNYTQMLDMINQSILWLQALFDVAIPLLRNGYKKRIALLSHTNGSISITEDVEDIAWHMILSSYHMMMKNYFNLLRPEGFTFRCFALNHGDAFSAAEYINTDFCFHSRVPFAHSEENRIVLRDGRFREITW